MHPLLTDDELASIRDALRRGDKIEAIKRFREIHPVGLAEAKHAVEAVLAQEAGAPAMEAPLERSGTPTAMAALPDDSLRHIGEAIFAGNKIEAIRRYREVSRVGLAEAKRDVEELEFKLRITPLGKSLSLGKPMWNPRPSKWRAWFYILVGVVGTLSQAKLCWMYIVEMNRGADRSAWSLVLGCFLLVFFFRIVVSGVKALRKTEP